MKLRVKTRTPTRNIAAPMLSPAFASIGFPPKKNVKVSSGLAVAKRTRLLLVREKSSNNSICLRVSHGLQPLSATKTMKPPFGVNPGLIAPDEAVLVPIIF